MRIINFRKELSITLAAIQRASEEAHRMWHAGASFEEVRERVTSRLESYWRNAGGRSRPPRFTIWAYRQARKDILTDAYGAKACQPGSEMGICEEKKDQSMEGASER